MNDRAFGEIKTFAKSNAFARSEEFSADRKFANDRCANPQINRGAGSSRDDKEPMLYKTLTDDELVSKTEETVQIERESTAEVIRLFEEIQSRKLHLKYGYPSLFEMATKHFGYCAASAMRRINAMRLIKEVPKAFEKIESGELSLSVVNELQTYFQQEKKLERPYSINAKIELIEASLGKSRRDVEREIASRNPERVRLETIYAVSSDRMRMNISISKTLLDQINHLRDLRSHAKPNMTIEELLTELVELGLEKHDPARKDARKSARLEKRLTQEAIEKAKEDTRTKTNMENDTEKDAKKTTENDKEKTTKNDTIAQRAEESCASKSDLEKQSPRELHAEGSDVEELSAFEDSLVGLMRGEEPHARETFAERPASANPLPPAEVKQRTRYIPVSERPKREPCCYTDSKTGRRCNSTRFLQLDHVTPFSKGGTNTKENLRWLCGAHNRHSWETRVN